MKAMCSDDGKTDFELGFELDSAELRVVLLCMGKEYGRFVMAVF